MLRNHTETCRLLLGAVVLLLALSSPQPCLADPLDTWHVRSYVPVSDLYGVTYANGVWVAVGNNGTLTTSTDQLHWTARPLVSDSGLAEPCLFAVTYGGGLFVAVGTYIWTSPDGVKWTYRASTAGPYGGVAYGNGRFVAAGGRVRIYDSGTPPQPCTAGGVTGCGLATSEDGITWTDRSTTAGVTTEPTVGLVYADGKFVQLGWHQPPYYSADGLKWTPATSPNASLYNHGAGLAYGNGVFVAVGTYLDAPYGGTVMTSNDGVSWTRTTGPAFHDKSICFGNGIFMATGSDSAVQTPPSYATYTSTDGVTWTAHENNVTGNGIAASPGSFTLVSGSMSIDTTSDGNVWTELTAALQIQGTALSYGNGVFVSVGTGGKIYTSPDGLTWTGRSNASLTSLSFKSVVYGAKGFVAAGVDANSGVPAVATSIDGSNWSYATASGCPSSALAFGNGVYVGVGGSIVYSSTDGAAWTARASASSGALNGAAFGNGKFVVVGDSATMTSTDGTTWTSRSSGGYRLTAVAAGNNLFAAAGDNGAIMVSADGVSWSNAASGVTGNLTGMAYGAGRLVAIGGQGSVSDSTDGRTWTVRSLGYTGGPWAIAYGGSTFVAVSGNTVLQSDPLPQPAPAPTPAPDPQPAAASSGGGGGGGGGCFIATAAYGGDFAWQVKVFRGFRDRRLLTSRPGRTAVRLYYAFSPPLAALIAGRPALKAVTRLLLTPVACGIVYPGRSAAVLALCLFAAAAARRKAGKEKKKRR